MEEVHDHVYNVDDTDALTFTFTTFVPLFYGSIMTKTPSLAI